MGKTTSYHPVGLTAVRGAAQYGGWKLGRFHQIATNPGYGVAEYRITVEGGPANFRDWPVKTILKQLKHCFMSDVEVTKVVVSQPGPVTIYIKTRDIQRDDVLYGQSEYGDITVTS